ncbi:COG1361 S-layer family protein [Halomicrobium sp. IBSBa]|uniref:COG1361 S-layer family protein n=1 Tax=Halomicrobium sp. IBSBa TaxID=2778916 RepID=UPI001ABF0086|nr:COG1361 S-layer family protein [Halomicrobium sp. IBSBa]MBO4249108.1 COG1361 S-layer family protein [Halomicrobium sp. IBSBa]
MNGRTLLPIAVVVLLVTSGLATAAVTGSPDISVHVADDTLAPGEESTLDVVLVNSGDLDSGSARNPALNGEVTTARGTTVSVDKGNAPLTVKTDERAVGSLPEGSTREPLPFAVSVPDDAEPGTYDVQVTVEYDYYSYVSEASGSRDRESETRTYDVQVNIEESAQLDVTDVDTTTRVDGTGTVELTVENNGSVAARDTTLTLASPSADLTLGQSASAERYVEQWEPDEERTFTYRLSAARTAESEPYPFTLTADYELGNGESRTTQPVTVEVTPEPEQEFTVSSIDSSVPVGDSGDYTVTLRNDGSETLTDASVQVTSKNADITFGQSNSASQYVDEWESGEERTLTFDARAGDGAERRNYTVDATVEYDRPDDSATHRQDVSLSLRPVAEQTFAVDSVDADLEVGDDGTLSAELTNTGPRTAEDVVVVWASEQRNVDPIETEYSIGNLGAGESASFDFDVDISDSARSGPRQFTLQTRYNNDDDEQRTGDSMNVRAEVAPERDEFDVAIRSANVSAGEGTEIVVEITNAKNQTLSDINAKIFADSPISANDDEAFVDELPPGESRELIFSISAGGSALSKPYPVSMDFQYDEADGDTVTSDTYNIPVEVEESGGGGSPLVLIGVAVVLIVAAVGGYVRFR